jgi:sugar phosphate isomerase/epimerase
LKDAISSDQPGTKWGREVDLGRGQVPILQIVDALDDVGYTGPLVIECEFDPTLAKIKESLDFIRGILT